MVRLLRCSIVFSLAFVCAQSETVRVFAQTNLPTRESAYYQNRIGNRTATFRASGANSAKDTNDLNALIRNRSNSGGATITVTGPNTIYLGGVKLLDKIHLKIRTGMTIRRRTGAGRNVFEIGLRNRVTNVAITSTNNGRFTMEAPRGVDDYVAINLKLATNFLLSNVNIREQQTRFTGIEMNPVGLSSTSRTRNGPRNGIVKNITCTNNNFGYGLIQVRGANKVLYKNLRATGGSTLRLESGIPGGVGNKAATYVNLVGRNIRQDDTSDSRSRAVLMAPHRINQGIVDIRGIVGKATVGKGFLDKKGTVNNIGRFDYRGYLEMKEGARGSIIDNNRPGCPRGCVATKQSNGRKTNRKAP